MSLSAPFSTSFSEGSISFSLSTEVLSIFSGLSLVMGSSLDKLGSSILSSCDCSISVSF